jgi:hypothetical protein
LTLCSINARVNVFVISENIVYSIACKFSNMWRWVAKFDSAPAFYGSSMGSDPDISRKYNMGYITTHSSPPKKYPKSKKYRIATGQVYEEMDSLEN